MLLDMPDFESFDGTRLAYEVDGDGDPVVLLHGFASDSYINWIRSGVVDALTAAGFRTIALDQRGHGTSDKPHDPAAYAGDAMPRDAIGLLDHLELGPCAVVGFSMGAWITLAVAAADDRVTAAVCGGIGGNMAGGRADRSAKIADALEAEDKSSIDDAFGRSFRDFADLTRADRTALAALQRADRDRATLGSVEIPLLFVCGDNDPLAGSPHDLAERFADARAAVVGGTHLNVVNNPAFHAEIVGFLRER